MKYLSYPGFLYINFQFSRTVSILHIRSAHAPFILPMHAPQLKHDHPSEQIREAGEELRAEIGRCGIRAPELDGYDF